MKGVLAIIVGLGLAFAYLMRPSVDPTNEQLVTVPRAELYASLNELLTSIERKAGKTKTVTGTPPVPVDFTFERSDGEMLALEGQAGFRTVTVKAWLDDGDKPGTTRLRVKFFPEDMYEKSGYKDLRYALQYTLRRTDEQFIEGHRITTLFGGQEVASR